MAKRGEFVRHFPLLGVEHDCLISKGGDLTVGFRVDLPEIFKLAASDYDALHELWVRALRMLPPGRWCISRTGSCSTGRVWARWRIRRF